jgi:hypothetical protein
MLLACSPCAFALNPALDISQYAHTAWKIRHGFTRGAINSIAQTPDGYLWLGTQFGLLRFDGVRNVPWQPPPDQHLPSSEILKLLVGTDGTLWIGTREGACELEGRQARPVRGACWASCWCTLRRPAMTAHCSVAVTGHPRPRSPEIEEELLRIAQEAANNANRHAQATEIRIALDYSAGSLKLSISDNGRGFDFEEGYSKSGHWGLKNMQERAAQIRGKYTITTAVGQGTQVEIEVPLSSWFLRNTLAKHAHTSSGSR